MWHEPVTRYTLGVSAMFSFYWLCAHFVVSPLLAKRKLPKESHQLLSTALLYLPGLGLLLLFIKDLPTFQISSQGFVVADYVVVFAAQFFAFVLIALFSILEVKLGLISQQALEQPEDDNKGINAFMVMTVVPLLEELMSRKLLGELLGSSQTGLFLWLSALVFSLIHLQTGRIAVAVSMFYTGFLWAWVYAGSGSLLLCTAYHIVFNLMMVFIPERLKEITSQKVHKTYIVSLILVGTVGFVLLAFNSARFLPPALPDAQNPFQRIFGNWGFWVLAAVCAGSYLRMHQVLKAKSSLPEGS